MGIDGIGGGFFGQGNFDGGGLGSGPDGTGGFGFTVPVGNDFVSPAFFPNATTGNQLAQLLGLGGAGNLGNLFGGALSNGQGGLGSVAGTGFLGPLGDIFGSIFSGGGIDGTGDLGVLGDLGGLLGTILLGDSNILDGLQGGPGGILGAILGGGLGGAGGAGGQPGAGGIGGVLGQILRGAGGGAAGAGGLAALASLLGNNSQGDSARFGSLNPAFGSLLGIFGSQLDTRQGVVDNPANTSFFETPEFRQRIADLAQNPPGLFASEQQLGRDFLSGGQPSADLANARSQIANLLGQAQDLTTTGFRTSAQPAFEEAERRLRQNILPQIAEIAGQNVGISSSSFLDSANRSAADLLGEASLQQISLDEAAANRRAAAQPIFGQLIGTQLGLQPAFANDLSALGGALRNVQNSQQARPLDVFQILSGLGQGQQFIQQGFNPAGNRTTQLFEGLASALPELASVLGQGNQTRSLSSLFGG